MVGNTSVQIIIVINSTIKKLEPKVSLITTYSLMLFVIVYNGEML